MPTFTYLARDAAGREQRGSGEAANAPELVSQLRQQGLLVLEVEAERVSGPGLLAWLSPLRWLPVGGGDVELALQQLAVMLRSGLTLLNALKTAAEYAERLAMRKVLLTVAERVTEGMSFADALARHRCFGPMVVQLVRVGEATGALEPVLLKSAQILRSQREVRRNLVMAMLYPGIVFLGAIGVTAFMMLYAIPKIENFLAALGRRLPWATQLVVDVSHFLQAWLVPLIVVPVLAVLVVVVLRTWAPGRLFFDRLLLRIPLLGKLSRLAGTAMCARALGLMLESGVRVLDGLRICERLLHNRALSAQLEITRERVLHGGTLAEPLAGGGFMPMLSRMVAVGETAGTLDEVLAEVARFHEDRLEVQIKKLAALAEPAIIVFVGGVVGFVYIAFFMALFAAAGGSGG